MKGLRKFVLLLPVFFYLLLSLAPIYWLLATSLKSYGDAYANPPALIPGSPEEGERGLTFTPRWENYTLIFSTQNSEFPMRLLNSVIVSGISTAIAVVLGTLAAYGFSRFPITGQKDLLFFILSTRMLPPVVIAIPVFLMFTQIGLRDTRLGLIILYVIFNLSFAVWMMKGFIDEIPREYEEAALVDGYTRLEAFSKVVLPQAWTGIAATAVFCLITAWNEFAFALILTNKEKTAPVYITQFTGGSSGIEWGPLAASSVIFMIPVVVFTFLMRNHLLRGITFGTLKK
jgi:multiple sugar transport system permease protein